MPATDFRSETRIFVRDLRALADVQWILQPGVSLLVGPNGSGKSTLLAAVAWLQEALKGAPADAVQRRLLGTADLVRHGGGPAFHVGIGVGSWEWSLGVVPRSGGIDAFAGESLSSFEGPADEQVQADTPVLSRDAGASQFSYRGKSEEGDQRTVLSWHKAVREEPGVRSLIDRLSTANLYPDYGSDGFQKGWLRNNASLGRSERLDPDGRNVFVVLRKWHGRVETEDRLRWIEAVMHDAFTRQFSRMEFESVGNGVAGYFRTPGGRSLPWSLAADGMLQMLLWLTAVAGAPDGGLLMLDELEMALHPHAIAVLLQALRDEAEARQLTIVAATHSPVLLNLFKDEPERVFVLDPSQQGAQPRTATDLHDRNWLGHFALGDLYQSGDLGRQDGGP